MRTKQHQDIPLAGVLGNPIAQSLSPNIHNYWLRKTKTNGFYIPINVSSRDLEKTINDIYCLDKRLNGNPDKENVLKRETVTKWVNNKTIKKLY